MHFDMPAAQNNDRTSKKKTQFLRISSASLVNTRLARVEGEIAARDSPLTLSHNYQDPDYVYPMPEPGR